MKRAWNLAVLLIALPFATAAEAQFQSCTFCDVNPTNPDPMVVLPCQTGTLILTGIGFSDTRTNDCSIRPATGIRSTRPDRVNILSWIVLSDGSIQLEYSVPCSASPGRLGIDVTIDDNPTDAIEAYACGNARMEIQEPVITLSVVFDSTAATWTGAGVEIAWRTLLEDGTAGFDIWAIGADRVETQLPTTVKAQGPGFEYRLVDSSSLARGGLVVAYRLVERTEEGMSGTFTPPFDVAGRPLVRRGTSAPTGGKRSR